MFRCVHRCCAAAAVVVSGSRSGVRAPTVSSFAVADGPISLTRTLHAPFRYSALCHNRGTHPSGSKGGEAGERASSASSTGGKTASRGASGASMKATASVMNQSTTLMEDKEVAAAASKLLLLLAPTAKGKRQSSGAKHGSSAAAAAMPSSSTASSYLVPPQPSSSESSLASLSELSAPSDMLFGDSGFTGLPSRRTHILSRWQQKEFDEAFEAAEAVLQEEERERQAQKKVKRKGGIHNASGVEMDGSFLTDREKKDEHLLQPVDPMVAASAVASPSHYPAAAGATATSLANPFKGLHEHLRRSYRLDEIILAARDTDLVLAKQEPKASVFSFLTLHSGLDTYQKHWSIKQALRDQHDSENNAVDGNAKEEEYFEVDHMKKRKKSRAKKGKSEDVTVPEPSSTIENASSLPVVVVNDAALQWGGLGWDNPLVDVDYGLLLAQRLLLFPPAQRHFHALSGRVDVPCDFFADLDLPDCTVEEGERTLVEVLDYLEIRLPGVGFTDPFFLVLSNEEPEEMLTTTARDSESRNSGGTLMRHAIPLGSSGGGSSRSKMVKKKISYHIHARSMTHIHSREERSMLELRRVLKQQSRKRKSTKGKKRGKGESGLDEEEADSSEAAVGGASTQDSSVDDATQIANELMSNKKLKGATKVIAFQDYRSVKLIADEINQTLGFNAIDEGCYRTHGSLRCAFSRKIPPNLSSTPASAANAAAAAAAVLHSKGGAAKNSSALVGEDSAASSLLSSSSNLSSLVESGAAFAGLQPALVPLPLRQDQNEDLQRKLQDMHAVLAVLSAPEILELTFCTRHLHDGGIPTLIALQDHLSSCTTMNPSNAESIFKAATLHQFKLVKPSAIIGPQAAATSAPGAMGIDGLPLRPQGAEYDAYGNVVSPYLTEAAKWRRYKSVVSKLQHVPPRAAMSFDIWVRIGLALHNFSNEEHVFEEWVKFSLKCPQKYSREACRKKWLQFERNPDALNWRRGFNYLNQTLWRQI